jgi:hypothetical protein
MPAWVEDAQQLTELKDLSNSQSSVLLRTTEVEEFLSNLNLSSHALVAPKGFGKTLVLKLKRISLQEDDYRCFPFSPIVDRPSNKPPILPNEIINGARAQRATLGLRIQLADQNRCPQRLLETQSRSGRRAAPGNFRHRCRRCAHRAPRETRRHSPVSAIRR